MQPQPVWLHTVKRSLLIQPHCNMLPFVESGNASAGCFEVSFKFLNCLHTTSVRKLKYSSRSCCLRAKLGKALHMHCLWQQWILPTGVRPAIRSLIHWQRCITKNTFSSGRTWISGLHEVTVSYCLAYPCSFECFTSSFRGGKLNRVKWLASKFRKHVSVEKHRCEQQVHDK